MPVPLLATVSTLVGNKRASHLAPLSSSVRTHLRISLPRVLLISISTVVLTTVVLMAVFIAFCDSCENIGTAWFQIALQYVAIVMFILGWGIAVYGSITVMINLLRMTRHVNESIKQASFIFRWNTANLLFAPVYLTEPGLGARTKVMRGIALFAIGIVCCLPAFLVSKGAF